MLVAASKPKVDRIIKPPKSGMAVVVTLVVPTSSLWSYYINTVVVGYSVAMVETPATVCSPLHSSGTHSDITN